MISIFLVLSFGFFFFFQAEDGIRDKLVTGVQTCALPIFSPRRWAGRSRSKAAPGRERPSAFPYPPPEDRLYTIVTLAPRRVPSSRDCHGTDKSASRSRYILRRDPGAPWGPPDVNRRINDDAHANRDRKSTRLNSSH